MPHFSQYICGVCQKQTLRELIVIKQVNFKGVGAGSKLLKSRTKLWLCDECLKKDEDWNTEPFAEAPGLKSPARQRVRALQKNMEALKDGVEGIEQVILGSVE